MENIETTAAKMTMIAPNLAKLIDAYKSKNFTSEMSVMLRYDQVMGQPQTDR